MTPHLYTIGWLLWLAWFVIEEGFALIGPRNGRTLSEHFWNWASIRNKGKAWRLRRFIGLAFLCWLISVTGGIYFVALVRFLAVLRVVFFMRA